jgi:hypothetical protein
MTKAIERFLIVYFIFYLVGQDDKCHPATFLFDVILDLAALHHFLSLRSV